MANLSRLHSILPNGKKWNTVPPSERDYAIRERGFWKPTAGHAQGIVIGTENGVIYGGVNLHAARIAAGWRRSCSGLRYSPAGHTAISSLVGRTVMSIVAHGNVTPIRISA